MAVQQSTTPVVRTIMATASTDVLVDADDETLPRATHTPHGTNSSNNMTPNPSPPQASKPAPARYGTLDLTRTSTSPSPYFSLPLWRKSLILFCLSFTALAATFSSTSLFSVVDEISKDLNTSSSSISISNAGVLLTMGFSSFIWGPIGRIVGRRWGWIGASTVFLLFTIGTGLAKNGNTFTAMRVLGGIQGTYFHVAGQTYLADLFEPIQRGTATGFFLAGTVFGPPFGPCVAGIIVTFTTWRVILWLQAAMMAVGLLLSVAFLPDIQRSDTATKDGEQSSEIINMLKEFDCRRVFKPLIYPNVVLTDLSCGLLSWCQYSLLAAPRHLLSPRFHFNTPLASGLFYIAPGCGFLLGTVIGGRFSDITVRKWIKNRGGIRLPQDRLKSGAIPFFFLIPVSSLIYAWGLQYEVGGLVLPIITAFSCAAGLLMAFASLNTYCAEVLPRQRSEVIAGKYMVQYTFSAVGSAAIVPLIDAIGIGFAGTIGVIFTLIAGSVTFTTAKYGLDMQMWMEGKLKQVKDEKLPL